MKFVERESRKVTTWVDLFSLFFSLFVLAVSTECFPHNTRHKSVYCINANVMLATDIRYIRLLGYSERQTGSSWILRTPNKVVKMGMNKNKTPDQNGGDVVKRNIKVPPQAYRVMIEIKSNIN
jgi:hypothetical protein